MYIYIYVYINPNTSQYDANLFFIAHQDCSDPNGRYFIIDIEIDGFRTTVCNVYMKLAHTGVEIDACAFQTGCQLSYAASGMSLELCFWHNFSGMKRTCWTTGSWQSCLSLEVVSWIPAWSTIIYRFLCGFICASLCQSIKIKPTKMYMVQMIITLIFMLVSYIR